MYINNEAARLLSSTIAKNTPSSVSCIDKGTLRDWMTESAIDLDGERRVRSRRVDIGATSSPPTAPCCSCAKACIGGCLRRKCTVLLGGAFSSQAPQKNFLTHGRKIDL